MSGIRHAGSLFRHSSRFNQKKVDAIFRKKRSINKCPKSPSSPRNITHQTYFYRSSWAWLLVDKVTQIKINEFPDKVSVVIRLKPYISRKRKYFVLQFLTFYIIYHRLPKHHSLKLYVDGQMILNQLKINIL